MSEDVSKNQYSADSIQALEGMEHVRMRPSMYIGDVGTRGLHHLVYEVIDNSIDEALAGHCDKITVTINEDNSITTEDNGRGIPVGLHKKEGVSALEVVMTKIGAGGKFDKDSYKVSGGLHGVGVSCVNALSAHLKATVHREGKVWEQEYERGKAMYPVKSTGSTDKRGTIVTFKPDPEIFTQTLEYNYETLANRMRELSFLNKGITVVIVDKRETCPLGKKSRKGKPFRGDWESTTGAPTNRCCRHRPRRYSRSCTLGSRGCSPTRRGGVAGDGEQRDGPHVRRRRRLRQDLQTDPRRARPAPRCVVAARPRSPRLFAGRRGRAHRRQGQAERPRVRPAQQSNEGREPPPALRVRVHVVVRRSGGSARGFRRSSEKDRLRLVHLADLRVVVERDVVGLGEGRRHAVERVRRV